MKSYWRERAAPIIAACIAAHPEADEKELRRLIRPLYCFARREAWPYKVWLSEVKAQLDQRFGRRPVKQVPLPPRQEVLDL